jgi:hypothetical protein
MKYWFKILQMEKAELVGWQSSSLTYKSWAKELKGELDLTGLACIWQNPHEHGTNRTCKGIKDTCNKKGIQNSFANIRGKKELKRKWGKEA